MQEVEGWTKAQAWGCSQGIPSSSSTTIRSSPLELSFYHFAYYVLFLGASICFALFAGHMQCWILSILFGRETGSTFSLEYSCASLISYRVFLAVVVCY